MSKNVKIKQEAGDNGINVARSYTTIEGDGNSVDNSQKTLHFPRVFKWIGFILFFTLIGIGILKAFNLISFGIDETKSMCNSSKEVAGIAVLPFYNYSGEESDYQQSVIDKIEKVSSEYNLPIEAFSLKSETFYPGGKTSKVIKLAKNRCLPIAVWGSYENNPESKVLIHFAIANPNFFKGLGKSHVQSNPEPFSPIDVNKTYSMNKIEDLVFVIGALVAYENGDYKTSSALISKVSFEDLGKECHELKNYSAWASINWYLGRSKESEKLATKLIDLAEANPNCSPIHKAQGLDQLAIIKLDGGNPKEARKLTFEAINIAKYLPNRGDSLLGYYYTNLANSYFQEGKYDTSLIYQNKAMDRFSVFDSPNRNWLIAHSQYNLSSMNLAIGNYEIASELVEEALSVEKKIFPENHEYIAKSLSLKGKIEWNLGNHKKAMEYLTAALEIRKKILPENHIQLGHNYHNLATVGNSGCIELESALEMQEKAIHIFQNQSIIDTSQLVTLYGQFFSIYINLNQLDKAKEQLDLARDIQFNSLNGARNSPKMVYLFNHYTEYFYIKKDFERALSYNDSAWMVFQPYLELGIIPNEKLATLYNNKAILLAKSGDCTESIELAELSLDYLNASNLPKTGSNFAATYSTLAEAYYCAGDLEKSLQFGLTSKEMFEKMSDGNLNSQMRLSRALDILASIRFEMNEFATSKILRQKSLEILEGIYPNGYHLIDEIKAKKENSMTSQVLN